ncbi:hypothetical protein SA2016_2902 [Sinomonas atrocyanea]|uniref:Uncharacterized protein n=1 Tax=Sinomonas atrocyanea TaxID=37927 RepID=A0A127A303_9MICC|nr:hypothetical protein [Sinomonas atrocyanea]AMM33567.1 hypothetical protein SA2016_2902 [Sinomonas atrocyanea]GEB66588.1 hypothetical protein SAT01_40360 [Sinomonas atrocyanea]GGG71812.1 hypothetical protein GCM10007172_25180 [Sinomonas atrocyanea]
MRQLDRDTKSGAGRVQSGGQRVVAHDGSREVHGYAVGATDGYIEVVWAVASGRQRRRAFPAGDVFIPSHAQQWAGVPISDDGLRLGARAAKAHAAQAQAGRPERRASGHSRWATHSDHAA